MAGTGLDGMIGGGILGSLFSFPSWILLILAAIFYLINASKAKQAIAEVKDVVALQEELM